MKKKKKKKKKKKMNENEMNILFVKTIRTINKRAIKNCVINIFVRNVLFNTGIGIYKVSKRKRNK